MPRFFVSEEVLNGKFAVLTGQSAAHIKVLRLKRGDEVTLCTGDGSEHRCVISDLSPEQVSLVVQKTVASVSEPKLSCTLYVAFLKADKLEHVLQKATELGAARVVVFLSSRCVSRPDEASLRKKLERWRKIAAAAAEQSGRGRIPQVDVAANYDDAIRQAAQAELPLFLYENEDRLSLRSAVEASTSTSVSVVTGPEGGFSAEEVAAAQHAGLRICSLGPRILRCETAPLCALSALMYATGALDPV